MKDPSDTPGQYRVIRIFVASPGDVASERDELARVIDELNRTIRAIAPEKRVRLELVRWETDAAPGIGRDPQDVVNWQIGSYDIFVGLLWKRMGTPTAVARSGTEEEFRRAYEKWEQDKSLHVLFYFCQQPFPPPRSREEVEQLGKVVDFRSEISSTMLVWDYANHEEFADVIRPHLLLVLGQILSPESSAAETAERIAESVPRAEIAATRSEIAILAREYEEIRSTMRSGDARTRKMEVVASKMRTFGPVGHRLLPELSASESPGQRLAAVAILQATPDPAYISWLGRRFQEERPFVAYQAAVALLEAVRALYASHDRELRQAILKGKQALLDLWGESGAKRTNEYQVLDRAELELQQLTTQEAEKGRHGGG